MYLVTGGAGFIGSHIAAALVRSGARVRIFDSFASGRRDNLREIVHEIEIVEGDLRDPGALRHAAAGVEVIFHHGALPSIVSSLEHPHETVDHNVTGMSNLLNAAAEGGCRRLIMASSSSVYGDSPVLPKRESMIPEPKSPYACSKVRMEQLCERFAQAGRLETVVLRYFNAFGPRQDWDSPYALVVPRFLKALCEGRPPVIFGDGSQTRDFVYIDNIVQANLLAITAPIEPWSPINIASGVATSLREVYSRLCELMELDLPPEYAPPRDSDVPHSVADITLARERLGYRVEVDLAEGLARTVAAVPAVAALA
jgi:UDP-glucose 4-epimerase